MRHKKHRKFNLKASFKKRSKLSKNKSRKLFSNTAKHVHRKNVAHSPMRGGIRL
jgi:hypothetical protein